MQPDAARPSWQQIFLVCFKIGSLSFGGGLSGWIYREFVEVNRWVGDEEFTATLALCQILPGANVINLVICLGEDLAGPAGALGAFVGFLIGPVLGVIGLYVLIHRLGDATMLSVGLSGVAYVAIGLLMLICWRGLRVSMRTPAVLPVIAAVVVMVSGFGIPILATVLVMTPVSIALAIRSSRRDG
ncbi:chromate transporter [Salipiger sp.]|uniref:chromate transporter n=1 Tax=Salipiger sp. TaxID=2078585 RepID=UPI003A98031E